MSKLSNVSDEELRRELAERERVQKIPPTPIDEPDFSQVIALAKENVAHVIKNEDSDENATHYIWEEVMKAVYGPAFFDWYNRVVR